MGKMGLMGLLTASILCCLQPSGSIAWQDKTGAAEAPVSASSIKVTIATGGGLYGPVKSQFKFGEDIPVTISMTNTTDQPVKYCRSTSLFQDRPRLKKDGEVMPYFTNLTKLVDSPDAVQRCENSAAQQFYELQPKQTKAVDWFKINSTTVMWYQALAPGHYELVLMRRVGCCQGSMLESNKVSFEIVP